MLHIRCEIFTWTCLHSENPFWARATRDEEKQKQKMSKRLRVTWMSCRKGLVKESGIDDPTIPPLDEQAW